MRNTSTGKDFVCFASQFFPASIVMQMEGMVMLERLFKPTQVFNKKCSVKWPHGAEGIIRIKRFGYEYDDRGILRVRAIVGSTESTTYGVEFESTRR